MKYTKEKIEKEIARIKIKIDSLKQKHGKNPAMTHTYHAGWSLGYWEGRLSAFEDNGLFK